MSTDMLRRLTNRRFINGKTVVVVAGIGEKLD